MLVFGGVPATMVSWVESVLPENSGFIRIPVCWCCDKSWCLVDVGFLGCRGVVENSRTFRMTIQWVSEIEIVRLSGLKPPTSYMLSFLVLSNNRFGQWTIDRFDSQRVVHIFMSWIYTPPRMQPWLKQRFTLGFLLVADPNVSCRPGDPRYRKRSWKSWGRGKKRFCWFAHIWVFP